MRLRAVDPTPTAAGRAARRRSIRPPEQGCGGKEGEAALTGGTERPGAADGCTQHRPKRRRAPHRQVGMEPQRGQKPRFGEKRSSEPPARPAASAHPWKRKDRRLGVDCLAPGDCFLPGKLCFTINTNQSSWRRHRRKRRLLNR